MTEKISVNRLPITLAQFLKWVGLAITGGEAKDIIRTGLIYVNSQTCLLYGKQLRAGDIVTCKDEADKTIAEYEVILKAD